MGPKIILAYLRDKISGRTPKGFKRSPKWYDLQQEIIKAHPYCSVCGRKDRLQVHHIIPFHIDSSLELDPENCRVLCARKKVLNCHLIFGHLGDFSSWNPSLDADIAYWRVKLQKKDR